MKVIAAKNLPKKLPVWPTVIILLSLDNWKASEFTRGVVYALLVILWIIAIAMMIKETRVDIFKR